MDTPATYVSWQFVLISVPNLFLLIGMIVVFVVALVAPFPHEPAGGDADLPSHD